MSTQGCVSTTTWRRLQAIVDTRLREAQQFLSMDTIVQLVHLQLRELLPWSQIPAAALQLQRLLGSPGAEAAGAAGVAELPPEPVAAVDTPPLPPTHPAGNAPGGYGGYISEDMECNDLNLHEPARTRQSGTSSEEDIEIESPAAETSQLEGASSNLLHAAESYARDIIDRTASTASGSGQSGPHCRQTTASPYMNPMQDPVLPESDAQIQADGESRLNVITSCCADSCLIAHVHGQRHGSVRYSLSTRTVPHAWKAVLEGLTSLAMARSSGASPHNEAVYHTWKVVLEGSASLTMARSSGTSVGPHIMCLSCVALFVPDRWSRGLSSPGRMHSIINLQSGYRAFTTASGRESPVQALKCLCPLGRVCLPVAPASVMHDWAEDDSLEQLHPRACHCSTSAQQLRDVSDLYQTWLISRHEMSATSLNPDSACPLLCKSAMPLPGTPLGGERPAREAVKDAQDESAPDELPAEEDGRDQSPDIFENPEVIIPEKLSPPRKQLGYYAVQALRHTLRLGVKEARPTAAQEITPGPSCIKGGQLSRTRRRYKAVAKVLAKAGLRCLVCYRPEGLCLHCRPKSSVPVWEKVATCTMHCASFTHCMSTITDRPFDPFGHARTPCHQVICPGLAVSVSAALRCPEPPCAGILHGSTGTDCGIAEGFASPFWKPHGGHGISKRDSLTLQGACTLSCFPACCTDSRALYCSRIARLLSTSLGGWALNAPFCRSWGPWLADSRLLRHFHPLVLAARGNVGPMRDAHDKAIEGWRLRTATSPCFQTISAIRTPEMIHCSSDKTSILSLRHRWRCHMQDCACQPATTCDSGITPACWRAVCCPEVGRSRAGLPFFRYSWHFVLAVHTLSRPRILPSRHFCALPVAMHQWKSKCTLQRQGTRPGKRQRDAMKEDRERKAMQLHDKPEVPRTPPERRDDLAHATTWPAPHHEASSSVGSAWASPIPLQEPGESCWTRNASAVKTESSSDSGIQTLPLTVLPQGIADEPLDAQVPGPSSAITRPLQAGNGNDSDDSGTEESSHSSSADKNPVDGRATAVGQSASADTAPEASVQPPATSCRTECGRSQIEEGHMSSDSSEELMTEEVFAKSRMVRGLPPTPPQPKRKRRTDPSAAASSSSVSRLASEEDLSSSSSSSSSELRDDPEPATSSREIIPRMELLRAKLLKVLRQKARLTCSALLGHDALTPARCTLLPNLYALQVMQTRCMTSGPLLSTLCPTDSTPYYHTRTGGSGALSEQAGVAPGRGRTHIVQDWSDKTRSQKQTVSHHSMVGLMCMCLSLGCLMLAMMRFSRGQRIGGWATERLIPGTYIRRYRLFRCTCAGSRPSAETARRTSCAIDPRTVLIGA